MSDVRCQRSEDERERMIQMIWMGGGMEWNEASN
jgi:hypothetical protein